MSIQHAEKGKRPVSAAISLVAEAEEPPVCWICLDGPQPDKPLTHPCRCPSFCHASCIARWQLQSAGTRREKYCDFCSGQLPDWKSVLTPNGNTSAPAVMNVNFDNKTYSFQVSPGADGYRQFTEAIRKAFHLPEDSELNITFTCDEPSTGALLTLSGPGAYDAAVHCASVSAARRSSLSNDGAPGSPSSSGGALNDGPGSRNGRRSSSSDCQQPPFDARLPAHRAAAAASERGMSAGGNGGGAGGAVGAAGGAPLRPLTPVSSFLAASHSSRQLQLLERQPSSHQYGCDDDHHMQQQLPQLQRRRHSSPGGQQHQEEEAAAAGGLNSHWLTHSSSGSLGAASAASSSGSLLVRTTESPQARASIGGGNPGGACPSPAGSDSNTYVGGANNSSSSSASSSRASSPRVTLGRTGSSDTTTSATSSRGGGSRSAFAGAAGSNGNADAGGNAPASGSGLGGQRRGSGFGRKLRNALSDLLIIK